MRLLDTLAEIASNAQLKTMAPPVVRPAAPLQDGVLDSSVLDELASLGMGEGFEREFIRQCLEDVASCMGKAEQAGEATQWDVFREQSHAIKGVASNPA